GLGPLAEIRLLSTGRVNRTFFIRAAGAGFALQRLHPVFGPDGVVVENVAAATECLAAAGLPTPRVKPAVSGTLWVEVEGLWRLMTWLPGNSISRRSPEAGAEAARFLGLVHRALAAGPPVLKPLPPAEHNRDRPASAHLWDELIEKQTRDSKFSLAASLLDSGRSLTHGLPSIRPVTRGLLHGDPKLENFLFDDSGCVVGLVDLDTVRAGFLVWEMADGLKSWAGVRGPDDKLALDEDIFLAAVDSYCGHGPALTDEELNQLPAAARALTLDLARRYLTDYFEESYFAWDRDHYPSLAEQNLRRGAGLLHLAEELAEQETRLSKRIKP
ncbi:MAG: phosphotransferase, partial [Thermodesulfobacteriota bacterium]|nr:phosphotransferase [Thermodesulfobacteriota bacterium]